MLKNTVVLISLLAFAKIAFATTAAVDAAKVTTEVEKTTTEVENVKEKESKEHNVDNTKNAVDKK